MIQERIYRYFERNPQLKVLMVFDSGLGFMSEELMGLSWPEGYVFHRHDGSWFNLKYHIEHDWQDKRVVLLFQGMRCPVSEAEQLSFPLMDVLKANMEYREDDYESFLQQYRLSDKHRTFVKKHIQALQSTKINKLLQPYLTETGFNEDIGIRGILSSYLGDNRLCQWEEILLKLMLLDLPSNDRKCADFYTKIARDNDIKAEISKWFKNSTGCDIDYDCVLKTQDPVRSLKYNILTQGLHVADIDTYSEYKVTDQLILERMNRLYEHCMSDKNAKAFKEVMAHLASAIKEEKIIEFYGIDAHYLHLTEKMAMPILDNILTHGIAADATESLSRLNDLKNNVKGSDAMEAMIDFSVQVAAYYEKCKSIGDLRLNSPRDYIRLYCDSFYEVDIIYRRALEAYQSILNVGHDVPPSATIAKQRLDKDYFNICNTLNIEWLSCIQERESLFGDTGLNRQDGFFERECSSMQKGSKLVVIVSDALRYEVAKELMFELAAERHVADLEATLAMLPTETKFCKPSLLPHSKLTLSGAEMLVDGLKPTTLDIRTSILDKYREGALCVSYEEVMNASIDENRERFKHPLVFIMHDTIDEAGHSQNALDVIHGCRRAIDQLRVLIRRIHASWNVAKVILTADHGFLYNDLKMEDKDKNSIVEEAIEKKTRYYLTSKSDSQPGVIKFPLNAVSGIKDADNLYVATPIGVNRFACPGGYQFAHGGASLQEMLVPMITSRQRRVDKEDKVGVLLLDRTLSVVSSRLKFRLVQTDAVTMTMTERKVVCQLWQGNRPVSGQKIVVLNSPELVDKSKRQQEVTLSINVTGAGSILQLIVADIDDPLNPLIKENVTNNTLIETDF